MIIQIQPWIDESEMIELQKVITSTFITEATMTKQFEEMTREMTGAKHAIAITNGTAALYCCLKALGIGPGDEVIVPTMTFIATANSVIMTGAKPVFCDVDPSTLCLTVPVIEKKLTAKTKAIMPVHLYGQSADMPALMAYAKSRNLLVVEDAAQGVGVKFEGKHVGTFGDLGILSYYGNKTITCGEGGIVLTDDDDLAKKVYRLKNHGREKKGTFIHETVGYNFSFTEMQAAIGVSQMKKLSRILDKKQQIYDYYFERLQNLPGIIFPKLDSRCTPVHWFTSIIVENAEAVSTFMMEKDVQTRRFFYPMNLQPCYKDEAFAKGEFPAGEKAYKTGLSLPSSYNLTREEQDTVISGLKDFFL